MSDSGEEVQVGVEEEAIELGDLLEEKVVIIDQEDNSNVASGKSPTSTVPKCKVVLDRIRLNEIRITSRETKREISYVGFDRGEEKKFQRKETIIALERDHAISEERRNDKDVVLQLSPESSIFNIKGMKDDVDSIMDVVSDKALSTMVLDAFLSVRICAHNNSLGKMTKPTPSYEVLSVHFLPIYDKKQKPSTFKPDLHLFPKVSLKNSILIAPLYICKHYYLAIYNFNSKTIHVYDSCWEFVPMFYRFHQVMTILKSLVGKMLSAEEDEDSWEVFFMEKCAQQEDKTNCGCYVIYFIENELKGNPSQNKKMNDKALVQIRHEIAKRILPSTVTGKKFLDAILA